MPSLPADVTTLTRAVIRARLRALPLRRRMGACSIHPSQGPGNGASKPF